MLVTRICRAKTAETDRDAVCRLTRVDLRNHVLDGVEIVTGRSNFWGCPAYWKALEVSAAVYAAKGNIQSPIMA